MEVARALVAGSAVVGVLNKRPDKRVKFLDESRTCSIVWNSVHTLYDTARSLDVKTWAVVGVREGGDQRDPAADSTFWPHFAKFRRSIAVPSS